MVNAEHFVISNEHRPANGERHPDAPETPEPYIASPELRRAVNLAIYLERPLLIEGEAGCGKSRLARHVAYALGLPLYEWPVRSTSKAEEGLYTYEAILRLHDVHIWEVEARAAEHSEKDPKQAGKAPKQGKRNPEQPMDYVSFGALGKAFNMADCSSVVLIDEIDKADIDFPNDLLTVLEKPWEFDIRETGQSKINAKHPPIVIITSNKEKGNLPAPFLRRCVYFYMQFPDDPILLKNIVDAHYKDPKEAPDAELTKAAATRFLSVRSKGDLYKKPGTSEFLDWIEALRQFEKIKPALAQLQDDTAKLPYPELLFKLRADWERYVIQL